MILITGGAGVMGRRLVERFTSKGKKVRIAVFKGDSMAEKLKGPLVDVCYCDITSHDSLKGIADGVDTVYHLAAIILSPRKAERFEQINHQGTINVIAECEKASVSHFIYISSASVTYGLSNPYSRSKIMAERAVLASAIVNKTIVRPTLAYETGGAEEFSHFVKYLNRFPIVPFIGSGEHLKMPVFVDDIIDGLEAILGNKKSYGKIYNFSGGSTVSLRRMAEMIIAAMGKKKRIIAIPVALCKLLSFVSYGISLVSGKTPLLTWQTISGVTQNAVLDHAEAHEDLGYTPRSFDEGLKQVDFAYFT